MLTRNIRAEHRFIETARRLEVRYRLELEALKTEKLKVWARGDGIWERLLSAMATMGGPSTLVSNDGYHARVEWAALLALPNRDTRLARLAYTMGLAHVHYGPTKAIWMASNFERIARGGGPEQLREDLQALNGSRDEKIKFLVKFDGISQKYARNMMMDIYDEDFVESVALDSRIANITEAFGQHFNNYAEGESFYLDLAHRAGLTGWQLDRLMYRFCV